MSLKYALLGLLARTPRHGYDLKRDFEANFSQMRSLSAGQVYVTLARLSAEGLVEGQTEAQSNAPAKKVFALTDAGRQALTDWLAQPVADSFEQVRSEFFLKLLVSGLTAGPESDAARPAMIERQRISLEENLADLKLSRLKLSLVLSPGEPDPRPAAEQELSEQRLLLLEGAILHLEADLAWLRLLETRLRRLSVLHRG